MFEWLEQEISTIKTLRFHLVDGPAGRELREVVSQSVLPLPSSYKNFVLKFGNARLYRQAQSDSYQIGVFAGPREVGLKNGTRIYQIGFHDGSYVYLKPEPNSTVFPVFEVEGDSEENVADDFEEWLAASCADARKKYGKEKWAEILRGPEPFTVEEREIIEARHRIQWRVLGIDSAGDHILEVKNTGNRTLSMLTIGVRSQNKRLNGAIILKIGHVDPGQTAILHADCYKDLVPSDEIELFALPDPGPEDREFYEELRSA